MSEPSNPDEPSVEWIMRRADAMGIDAQRVAIALNHDAPRPIEYQATEEVRPRSWYGRRLARRFARSS